jgi:hypothetical protein
MPVSGRGTQAGTDQPDAARVLNYWLGGNDNFAADREAGEVLLDPVKGHPGLRVLARENRAFVLTAVAWLARTRGIRQFLDLGCGLPVSPAVHDAARDVVPDASVAYVDRDPLVTGHVRALQATGPGLAAVEADVTDPAVVLEDPALRTVIDLGEPVAVVLGGTLSDMPADAARSVVAGFTEALAPGSAVVVSCACFDDEETARRIAAVFGGSWRNHSREDVAGFFAAAGLLPVRGEVGDVRCWPMVPSGCGRTARILGGVGIKT